MDLMDFVGTDFNVAEEDTMNLLATDTPITKTKLPTRKLHLPETGFLRIKDIIAPYGPIPVSKSTWWAGVKSGRFPRPVRSLGDRITAWRVEDIRAWIDRQKTVNSWRSCFFVRVSNNFLSCLFCCACHNQCDADKKGSTNSARRRIPRSRSPRGWLQLL